MFISNDNYLQDLLNLDLNTEKSFYLQPIHLYGDNLSISSDVYTFLEVNKIDNRFISISESILIYEFRSFKDSNFSAGNIRITKNKFNTSIVQFIFPIKNMNDMILELHNNFVLSMHSFKKVINIDKCLSNNNFYNNTKNSVFDNLKYIYLINKIIDIHFFEDKIYSTQFILDIYLIILSKMIII